uniref:Atrophin-1 n=1 Tax=Panagrellus redivivus TaxID=6233 RepID=A0A7E4UYF2_PANRE
MFEGIYNFFFGKRNSANASTPPNPADSSTSSNARESRFADDPILRGLRERRQRSRRGTGPLATSTPALNYSNGYRTDRRHWEEAARSSSSHGSPSESLPSTIGTPERSHGHDSSWWDVNEAVSSSFNNSYLLPQTRQHQLAPRMVGSEGDEVLAPSAFNEGPWSWTHPDTRETVEFNIGDSPILGASWFNPAPLGASFTESFDLPSDFHSTPIGGRSPGSPGPQQHQRFSGFNPSSQFFSTPNRGRSSVSPRRLSFQVADDPVVPSSSVPSASPTPFPPTTPRSSVRPFSASRPSATNPSSSQQNSMIGPSSSAVSLKQACETPPLSSMPSSSTATHVPGPSTVFLAPRPSLRPLSENRFSGVSSFAPTPTSVAPNFANEPLSSSKGWKRSSAVVDLPIRQKAAGLPPPPTVRPKRKANSNNSPPTKKCRIDAWGGASPSKE